MSVKIVKERNKPVVTLDVDTPDLIDNDIRDVMSIIKSNLLLGGNVFPFNPNRGIDKDKYLFEYQDKMTLQAEMHEFKTQIEGLDERISKVSMSANVEEHHVTSISAVIRVSGEDHKITIQV